MDGFDFPLHSSIVAPYILNYGSEDQKKRWLPRMASGELVGAIAMTEPGAGSDLQGTRTSALREWQSLCHQRAKDVITNGQQANLIIVVTKTDPAQGAQKGFLVRGRDGRVEGFRRGRNLDKIGLKSNDTSELFFDDVRVPADALLGRSRDKGSIS